MLQQGELKWLSAMAKDIDLDGLQESGLLVKGSDGWWEALDIGAIPYDVWVKIEEISAPAHPCGCPGNRIKVKFCPPSDIKEAQEMLERLRPVNESDPF